MRRCAPCGAFAESNIMPWTPETVPDAVKKKYSKRCQRAWARVANKELAKGTDEGTAIATAYEAANNCKAAGH